MRRLMKADLLLLAICLIAGSTSIQAVQAQESWQGS